MTYVIIQGKGLSGGVFCPPATGTRGMRDGQGPTLPWTYGGAFREFADGEYRSEMIQRAEVAPTGMGGFRTRGPGIGAVPSGVDAAAIEAAARQQLEHMFMLTSDEWYRELDAAINELPFFGVWLPGGALSTVKKGLQNARDSIRKKVSPFTQSLNSAVIDTIRDTSIPLEELKGRLTSFIKEYHAIIQARIKDANATARGQTIKNLVEQYLDAMAEVIAAALKSLGKGLGIPSWAIPTAIVGTLALVLFLNLRRLSPST